MEKTTAEKEKDERDATNRLKTKKFKMGSKEKNNVVKTMNLGPCLDVFMSLFDFDIL